MFKDLPSEIQKEIIVLTSNKPFDLSLVSKFFNQWVIPLKITRIDNTAKMSLESLMKVQKTIKSLHVSNNITDDYLKGCINLTSLTLTNNKNITDESLSELAKYNKLKSLRIGDNTLISDESISKLTSLTSLILWGYMGCDNQLITIQGLLKLVNLNSLMLYSKSIINTKDIRRLVVDNNLRELHFNRLTNINIDALRDLDLKIIKY